jgi:transposase
MNKSALCAFLQHYGQSVNPRKQTREELRGIAKLTERKLAIEEAARKRGHDVAWLPPYSLQLDAIETLWGVLKNDVRRHYSVSDRSEAELQQRILAAMQKFNQRTWQKAVVKVEQSENQLRQQLGFSTVNIVLSLVLDTSSDESDGSEDEALDLTADEEETSPRESKDGAMLSCCAKIAQS